MLQVEYVDIVQNWDAVTLLKGLLQSKHCARFFLAKDYIVSNNIEDEFVASFLCEHILCALRMFTGNTIAGLCYFVVTRGDNLRIFVVMS